MSSTPRPPTLRAPELISALGKRSVEYVIVGGLAVSVHGFVRATKDLDIVPAPDRANLQRLMAALTDLEAQPGGLEGFDPRELLDLNVENLELGGNWILHTRYGRLDVMQCIDGIRDYEQLRGSAVCFDMEGVPEEHAPYFAGVDDLIAMKHAAGRDQDLLDIAELERARGASE